MAEAISYEEPTNRLGDPHLRAAGMDGLADFVHGVHVARLWRGDTNVKYIGQATQRSRS